MMNLSKEQAEKNKVIVEYLVNRVIGELDATRCSYDNTSEFVKEREKSEHFAHFNSAAYWADYLKKQSQDIVRIMDELYEIRDLL